MLSIGMLLKTFKNKIDELITKNNGNWLITQADIDEFLEKDKIPFNIKVTSSGIEIRKK